MSSVNPVPAPPPAKFSNQRSRRSSEATYSDKAVQKILQRALELRADSRFSAQQLREMALELDISPEMLSAAVTEWTSQESAATSSSSQQPPEPTTRRQQWLTYALASAFMIGLDIATAGTLTWSIFPVLGWGLGLICGKCDCS
ncbi:MAG: 2TM domain-containing protein [Cyanobacteria bacterium P01_H01_bin.152]